MTNYSNDPRQCRVDIFKPSGKWYETITVCFNHYAFQNEDGSPNLIEEAFKKALKESDSRDFESENYDGWKFVCLEPYHEYSHPQMLINHKGILK